MNVLESKATVRFFDADQWNSYKEQDLAFTVNVKGDITLGLIK